MSQSFKPENPFATPSDDIKARDANLEFPIELSGKYQADDILSMRMITHPVQMMEGQEMSIVLTEDYVDISCDFYEERFTWKEFAPLRMTGNCLFLRGRLTLGGLVLPKHFCAEEQWEPLLSLIQERLQVAESLPDLESIPEKEPQGAFALRYKMMSMGEHYTLMKILHVKIPFTERLRWLRFFVLGSLFGVLAYAMNRGFLWNELGNASIPVFYLAFFLAIYFALLPAIVFARRWVINPLYSFVLLCYVSIFPRKLDPGIHWVDEEQFCLFTKGHYCITKWSQFQYLLIFRNMAVFFNKYYLECIIDNQFESDAKWQEFIALARTKISQEVNLDEYQQLTPFLTTPELKALNTRIASGESQT